MENKHQGGRIILNEIYRRIEAIDYAELKTDFDDIVFDLVDDFLSEYENENYALLILELSKDAEAIKIGVLLDICIWSSKDNGNKQMIETAKWINSGDIRKIEVSLNITDIYPLNDFNNLKITLKNIILTHPSLNNLCEFWLNLVEKEILKTGTIKN